VLSKLYRNDLHCIVSKVSIERSVFSKCLVFNFTMLHVMSHLSYFFLIRSSGVIIEVRTFYYAMMSLISVSSVELWSFQICTMMSDLKSLNTSLLEVMISSKYKHLFICELSNLTFYIIFDTNWASTNLDPKYSITWNNSRHAQLWRFYLDYRLKETGHPGIICIICHQVLPHPS